MINDEKKKNTIKKRQSKLRGKMLTQLSEMPIIQIACAKVGISRATYYRWLEEDKEFGRAATEAQEEGVKLICDMSESQLITLIKEKKLGAIQMWLRHYHPVYKNNRGGSFETSSGSSGRRIIYRPKRDGGIDSNKRLDREDLKGNSRGFG